MNLYDACLVQGFNKYKCPMHHVKSWFGSVCRDLWNDFLMNFI